jgi:hypothetical protein
VANEEQNEVKVHFEHFGDNSFPTLQLVEQRPHTLKTKNQNEYNQSNIQKLAALFLSFIIKTIFIYLDFSRVPTQKVHQEKYHFGKIVM